VPTFVDRGVSRGQRGGFPTVVNLSFLDHIYIYIYIYNMALIDASKEVCIELKVKKTKYMLVSRHQIAGQNWDVK
jgi:hypothetical protein